jgi:hypothetical protein
MVPSPRKEALAWYEAVWKLLMEVWVGSFLFALLFLPAVGLDLAVTWLKTAWEVSEFLAVLLTSTKYVIAVLDALLYVIFMLNMAWQFFNELGWKGANHG